jgi:hypothetical protein
LCSNEKCNICFEASFASHPYSINWSTKNLKKTNEFKKQSNEKAWFKCPISNHVWETTISCISNGSLCPYPCCNYYGDLLCSNKNCKICLEASFNSIINPKYWSFKNKLTPCQIKKNSMKKFLFNCENSHEFEAEIRSITAGQWCSKCKFKNQTECIQIIEKLSGQIFKQMRPKILNGLELDGYNEELKLAIEYNGKQHYVYSPFFHKYDENNFNKQEKRDNIKKELCHKNGIYLIIIPYNVKNKEKLIREEYETYLFLRLLI